MIPKADIVAWRQFAPWVNDAQVEQDLIISRALVAIFQNPFLAERLAFRGGTALHKIYFDIPRRYSEDIDLVQIISAPIGQVIDALQKVLNGFLGVPRRKQTEQSVTLIYRLESEGSPVVQMRLKVEINTREHFTVEGYQKQPFAVQSRWFKGNCQITTYTLEELLATKLRALYQRRKGRDLFDLWLGLTEGKADADRISHIFKHYMENEGQTVDSMNYEKNLQAKMKHSGFLSDLNPLLPADATYDVQEGYRFVRAEIIDKFNNVFVWEALALNNAQLQDLLQYVKDEGRICPQPGKWHELWEMLPERHRVGSGWEPPLPLILAAWDNTTGLEKMLRLKQHIEYAAEKGVLDIIDRFIRNLPPEEWLVIGR